MVDDPDVNYMVNSVTATNTPAVGGSSINETFLCKIMVPVMVHRLFSGTPISQQIMYLTELMF
jgi:hypothetical protein